MAKMEEQQKYIDIIRDIENAFCAMKKIRPLDACEVRYFAEEFSIGASHNSNAIEGNTFTYDETRLLLKEGITSSARSFREHEEIVGYKQGFDFLHDALKQGAPITEEFIKKIHFFVLKGREQAGEYRRIQNYVGDMFKVRFTPCPPSQVGERMRAYTEKVRRDLADLASIWGKETVPWLDIFRILAEHHVELERIHPFIDGNGRCGRLLLTYEFISLGLLPVDIRYEERARYYAALASYDDKEKYSTSSESRFEKMAKLLAESELRSMNAWLVTFGEG